MKCRMIRIHEVFQPEEQISNSAFCQFVSNFLAGSAVARGGAGGARAPPVFLLKGKNRPV